MLALRYWAFGWCTLFVSLAALYAASYYQAVSYFGHAIYLLGEYIFGYLVIVGIRLHAGGDSPPRSERWLFLPAAAWCFWLAKWAGGNINLLFAVHTLIYPYLFFSALRVLRAVKPGPRAMAASSI